MKSILVSAHNPMTGPRHLGHYLSTMCEWPSLEREHELFVIVDDLIAAILYPRQRAKVQERTFQVVREFLLSGIDTSQTRIVLTSMLPEVHELSLFTATLIEQPWCDTLYRESFAGILGAYARDELGLPRLPSVAEVVYPQLHLATLTLGLHADFFQGGEEMRGYLGLLARMAGALGVRKPAFLPGRRTFVPGSDGRHMATENAIYLSAPEGEIVEACTQAPSNRVLSIWSECNTEQVAISEDEQCPEEHSRKSVAEQLKKTLAKFRDGKISNAQIVSALEESALVARERLKDTLIRVKKDFGVPGYA